MLDRDRKWGWLFVAPWIIGIIAFFLMPTVSSFYFSFTKYNIINPPEFIGLKNYIKALTDPNLLVAYRNTFVFLLLYAPMSIFLACVLAVGLNQKFKSISVFRGIFFTPVVAPMVSVAAIWVMLYNPYGGILNWLLSFLGIGPFEFVFSDNWFVVIASVAAVCVWKGIGSTSIYLLASLQNINDTMYEAADIDGAGAFTKFFRITLPLLTPTIFYLMILETVSAINSFDIFKVMAQESSANITVIATMVYDNAFVNNKVGLASAMGWITFALVALITYVQNVMEKRWVYYE